MIFLETNDIDECELYPNKLCSHTCVNTIGSYRCECPQGYSLHSDESTCIKDQEPRKYINTDTGDKNYNRYCNYGSVFLFL